MAKRRTAVILAAVLTGVMVWGVAEASAHPLLVGSWGAETPPGGPTVYQFGPCEYVGGGMWRGPYTVLFAGVVTSEGDYYLRVYNGLEGVIALRDGLLLSTRVGIIDLGAGTLDYLGVTYRR